MNTKIWLQHHDGYKFLLLFTIYFKKKYVQCFFDDLTTTTYTSLPHHTMLFTAKEKEKKIREIL